MKIATFDVDAQNGFSPVCPNELPVPEAEEIVPELEFMATLGEIRIGSKDAHPANAVWVVDRPEEMLRPLDYPNADLTWVRHCEPGTKGFELLEGLPAPINYDYFVWKGMEPDLHPYGACYHDIKEDLSTGVIEFLKQHDVEVVVVGGLAFDFCVKTTVLQLEKAGFQVIVYLKATRALSPSGYEETKKQLDEMENIRLAESREDLAKLLN
ncbi:nicotinamidase [Listeria floridensis FSL S10-1187]|uniref:nicotinamidase n=1 Tax=Listeria floridensis FSL S10-1187 TaxID=1265817 RepID=A0ABN0RG24_9LIST|nr:nicotinamidase [Listeria floridensis]EUJ32749.1 nicotinamidase [Listeria floridensis FSL S10-1187]